MPTRGRLALFALLTACASGGPVGGGGGGGGGGTAGKACEASSECDSCEECVDAVCTKVDCECEVDSTCEDDDPCNGRETCERGFCAAGTPVECDVSDSPCFTIACEAAGSFASCVTHTVPCTCTSPAECDDGNACNGDEGCDGGGACTAGVAVVCDASSVCRNGICLPSCQSDADCDPCDECVGSACVAAQSCRCTTVSDCDDSDPCNGAETCAPDDHCLAGTDPCPPPPNSCWVSYCSNAGGIAACDLLWNNTCTCNGDPDCDDGDPCNGDETCQGDDCVLGTPFCPAPVDPCAPTVCVPGNPATCEPQELPDGTDCNDGVPCTTSDCQSGVCTGTPVDCDDGQTCSTGDHCDPALDACAYTFDHAACDDGVDCTEDTCTNDGCDLEPLDARCTSPDLCEVGTCNPAFDCTYAPRIGACGNECTTVGTCGGSGCDATLLPDLTPCGSGSFCSGGFCATADTIVASPPNDGCGWQAYPASGLRYNTLTDELQVASSWYIAGSSSCFDSSDTWANYLTAFYDWGYPASPVLLDSARGFTTSGIEGSLFYGSPTYVGSRSGDTFDFNHPLTAELAAAGYGWGVDVLATTTDQSCQPLCQTIVTHYFVGTDDVTNGNPPVAYCTRSGLVTPVYDCSLSLTTANRAVKGVAAVNTNFAGGASYNGVSVLAQGILADNGNSYIYVDPDLDGTATVLRRTLTGAAARGTVPRHDGEVLHFGNNFLVSCTAPPAWTCTDLAIRGGSPTQVRPWLGATVGSTVYLLAINTAEAGTRLFVLPSAGDSSDPADWLEFAVPDPGFGPTFYYSGLAVAPGVVYLSGSLGDQLILTRWGGLP